MQTPEPHFEDLKGHLNECTIKSIFMGLITSLLPMFLRLKKGVVKYCFKDNSLTVLGMSS